MPDPIVAVATGSRAFTSFLIALAALQHAAGDRTDVILRVGDARGADKLLRAAAGRLGWPDPDVKRTDWERWCPACQAPRSHRRHKAGRSWCPTAGHDRNTAVVHDGPPAASGVALLSAGLRNAGSMDCAVKMHRAGISPVFWCDGCGEVPMDAPCWGHSLPEVSARWRAETGTLEARDG